MLVMSTSDGFRWWETISGTMVCYREGRSDLWHREDSVVTLFIILKLRNAFLGTTGLTAGHIMQGLPSMYEVPCHGPMVSHKELTLSQEKLFRAGTVIVGDAKDLGLPGAVS